MPLAFLGALILAITICLGAAAAIADAPPTLVVNTPTNPTYTGAHVTGSINPNGGPSANYWNFEYSSNPSDPGSWNYGFGGEISGTEAEGSTPVAVGGELQGLRAGTEYFVRLADNNENFSSHFESQPPYPSFTTEAVDLPTVAIDPVTTFTATSAHFSATIDPEAPAGTLTPAEEAAYEVNWHFQCTPQCPGAEDVHTIAADSAPHAVSADATGLQPNSHYEVSLFAANAGDPVSAGPEDFTTATAKPSVETLPAFVLGTGTEAQLGGRVNPENSPSTYWIEYGTTTDYGTSVPAAEDADAGSGLEAHVFAEEVSGLALATTYHFRIVAENATGKTEGEDMTFTTPGPAPSAGSCPNAALRTGPSAALPDCRAYELATTIDLLGSSAMAVVAPEGGLPPWGAVASNGEAVLWGTRGIASGVDSSGVNDTYLSRRTPTGWTSTLASPPGSKIATSASFPAYASPNLDRTVWRAAGATIDPTDQDPIDPLDPTRFVDLYRRETDGSFTWLTRGSDIQPASSGEDIPAFGGASTDGLTVIFSDSRQLEPGAAEGGVYARVGQTTTLISRDENGVPLSSPRFQGVSADGSVAAVINGLSLYLRDDNLTHTVLAAEVQVGGISFESLSADGSKAFFLASDRLVADDDDTGYDLYEYNADTETLTRISAPSGAPAGPGPGNSDDCASPLPRTQGCDIAGVAVSQDGSRAYFASPEQLDGTKGIAGAVNLYVHEGGETRFVATLDPGDLSFGSIIGAVSRDPSARRVRVSPDGSKLMFESRARITAYDNAGHTEVYVYDSSTGSLLCASCRPSGAQPTGDASLREVTSASNPQQFSQDPMYLADSDEHGEHIFFQSNDAIVPQDSNGKYDVYEYDVASGTESLISTGLSSADSAYYGNSTDGRDVFFFTTDSLVPRDQNGGAFKVYDARIGGGFAEAIKPPACEGEGCRGAGSSKPADASPATANFSGPGNPKPKPDKGKHRRKKHHKKHSKHKRHSKHPSKGHKRDANRNGRTGR